MNLGILLNIDIFSDNGPVNLAILVDGNGGIGGIDRAVKYEVFFEQNPCRRFRRDIPGFKQAASDCFI